MYINNKNKELNHLIEKLGIEKDINIDFNGSLDLEYDEDDNSDKTDMSLNKSDMSYMNSDRESENYISFLNKIIGGENKMKNTEEMYTPNETQFTGEYSLNNLQELGITESMDLGDEDYIGRTSDSDEFDDVDNITDVLLDTDSIDSYNTNLSEFVEGLLDNIDSSTQINDIFNDKIVEEFNNEEQINDIFNDKIVEEFNNEEQINDFNEEPTNDLNEEQTNEFNNAETTNDLNEEQTNDLNEEQTNDLNEEQTNDFNAETTNDLNEEQTNDFNKEQTNDFNKEPKGTNTYYNTDKQKVTDTFTFNELEVPRRFNRVEVGIGDNTSIQSSYEEQIEETSVQSGENYEEVKHNTMVDKIVEDNEYENYTDETSIDDMEDTMIRNRKRTYNVPNFNFDETIVEKTKNKNVNDMSETEAESTLRDILNVISNKEFVSIETLKEYDKVVKNIKSSGVVTNTILFIQLDKYIKKLYINNKLKR